MLKLLSILALAPAVFALEPAGVLRPIDIVWYIVAFCVFIIFLTLHHMMIKKK